jgi:hypothetical protein
MAAAAVLSSRTHTAAVELLGKIKQADMLAKSNSRPSDTYRNQKIRGELTYLA